MLKFNIRTGHGGTDVVIDNIDSLLNEGHKYVTVEKTQPRTEVSLTDFCFLRSMVKTIF